MLVAPLGIDLAPVPAVEASSERPYFIYVATIESRKNHLLLLRIWERLAQELGLIAPGLVLIGRRGWQHERVVARIAGSAALTALMQEHNTLPDVAVARLLGGATAALYPSFAEGYGLPVAEALALGVPVICSDLPELREVGGNVPVYLETGDEDAWHAMIRAYTEPGSGEREAQMARLSDWAAPSWDQHFALVRPLIDQALEIVRLRPEPAAFAPRASAEPSSAVGGS